MLAEPTRADRVRRSIHRPRASCERLSSSTDRLSSASPSSTSPSIEIAAFARPLMTQP